MAARTFTSRAFGNLRHVRFINTTSPVVQLEKAPIKVFGVEGRYAHALFSAASKSNALDKVEKELDQIQSMFKSNVKLSGFCNDPTIKKTEKKDAIVKIMQSQKFSDITVNFMGVLADGSRLKRTDGIINAFGTIMRARRGEVDCTVITAKPMDASMMKQLTQTLKKFVKSNETLKIETKTDPSIVGGMIVNLGDYFIDMSTATKIKKYSRALRGEA